MKVKQKNELVYWFSRGNFGGLKKLSHLNQLTHIPVCFTRDEHKGDFCAALMSSQFFFVIALKFAQEYGVYYSAACSHTIEDSAAFPLQSLYGRCYLFL